jgi:hypothetical protein
MKKYLADQGVSFPPEVVKILEDAFEDACIIADAEALVTGTEADVAAVRQLLARRIIELAKEGERDTTRLVVKSLEDLALAMKTSPSLQPSTIHGRGRRTDFE